MSNKSLFKWWCHLHYWGNNSQRQFGHTKFNAYLQKSYSPKLLGRILRFCTQIVLWACVIKVCSNGGTTNIIGEIIAQNNLNIVYLMQTFENHLLQNYRTEFLDIAHK